MNTAELNSESIPVPEPETGVLRVQTRFGEFEADARNVLCFPVGLPGFEQCRRFVVLSSMSMAPVQCLHAVDGPPEDGMESPHIVPAHVNARPHRSRPKASMFLYIEGPS